jgi:integrase/recombinase XerD
LRLVKIRGNGQARVLDNSEINLLFHELSKKPKYACLFAICYFTGCRISEALHLETTDIREKRIIFRKSITKGKLKSRSMAISPALRRYLDAYTPAKPGAFFPGQCGVNEFLSRGTADRILRNACRSVGIEGVSTHSFRRSALTHMHESGFSLRTIQKISGHGDLGTLQLYLEVSDAQLDEAINSLSF